MGVRPLIHIGYQKTGTSWMQRFLFPREAGVGFASVPKREVREHFILTHPLEFDADAARDVIEPQLAEAGSDGAVPVISTERLSGSPHAGRYDAKDIAERLHATFPASRILIVVREQRAMIASVYRQYVRWGGNLGPARYLDPPKQGDIRLPAFDPAAFSYDRLVAFYHELFGAENVRVLPHELLLSDGPSFVHSIVEFSGATADHESIASLPYGQEKNVGRTGAELALRRRLNTVAAHDRVNRHALLPTPGSARRSQRLSNWAGPKLPSVLGTRLERELERTLDRVTQGRFGASNAKLSDLAGIDLASFGYDVTK